MVTLLPHQEEALKQLRSGSILRGGVGSGKSIVGIAYYFTKECGGLLDGKQHGYDTDYVPMKNPKDFYIITTAKKRDSGEWRLDLAKFLLDEEDDMFYESGVVIDSWNNIQKYTDVENAFFIFDEQRAIGSGAWSKAFIQIAKKNHWLLLSATPGDDWMNYVPVFIANGFYKNRAEFIRRHVVFSRIAQYPKVERYLEVDRLWQLRGMITVDMDFMRSTTRHDIDVVCEYDHDIYKTLFKNRWNVYDDAPIKNAAEMCRLLRRCVDTDPDKIEKVEEIIASHPRVIIFYNFNYELDILKDMCDRMCVTYAEWNGHKHQLIPLEDSWVYLVQYSAGSEGWNCIITDTIIFYSQNYSYKIMEQASGRIDRMNTGYQDLYYYHVRTNSSIDLAILKALKKKKNFNENNFVSFLET